MATIRVSCGSCGDLEVTARDLRVRVCVDTDRGDYRFRCQGCNMVVLAPVDRRVVDLLVAAGVRKEIWHLPAEIHERKQGPAITHDDVLAFHDKLHDPDVLAAALAELQRPLT